MDVKLQTARQGGLRLLRDLLRSGLPRNSGKRLSQGSGAGTSPANTPLGQREEIQVLLEAAPSDGPDPEIILRDLAGAWC